MPEIDLDLLDQMVDDAATPPADGREVVRAHTTAAVKARELQAWLHGKVVTEPWEALVPPGDRNGPRFVRLFISRRQTPGGGMATTWELALQRFEQVTGIPGRLVTWEWANDGQDGWPTYFMKGDEGEQRRLPPGWFYLLGWVGDFGPFRFEHNPDESIWVHGVEITQPSDLLDLLNEED